MQAYRLETIIQKDGTLNLSNLPLEAGSSIEVIILVQSSPSLSAERYPLRGKPVACLNPMEPIAQSDWSVMQ